MAESNLIENMVKDDRLGKKNGKGFYRYAGKKKINDPAVSQYISLKEKTPLASDDLVARMIYPMINEATRCLEEKIARRPQDVDLGMIFGTGFAPFRGGLLTYADTESIPKVFDKLSSFTELYGQRFKPSTILESIQKSGKNIYDFYQNK
jgi:3-hydroxyacyl-CoA dehydrogenase/enoyl-CoA hydratase/3-hydroxybutyryl-CoA epimerase